MSTMDKNNLKDILHSILFVAGDGIEKSFIAEKLSLSEKELDKAILELEKELSGTCGVHLIKYKNKIQLSSNPDYAEFISEVLNPIRENLLHVQHLKLLQL